jgi:hypothetical protein
VPTPTPVVIPGEDKSDEKLYYSTLLYHQSSSDDLSEELFFLPTVALAKVGWFIFKLDLKLLKLSGKYFFKYFFLSVSQNNYCPLSV